MPTTTPLIRSYEARIDDVSKTRRTVTAKINTGIVDRYNTVIVPSGGDFRGFMKAPAVLWEHGQDPTRGRMPIAHCSSLKYRRSEDDLLAVSQFKGDSYSQQIFENYADGTLTAFSIDFLPDQSAASRPTTEELRARPDWSAAHTVYRKWELTGYSAVAYPGNPEALCQAVARGLWVPDEVRSLIERHRPPALDHDLDSQGQSDGDRDEDDRADDRAQRYIKHEDGKWNVYSEAGKLLGSHDSEADAKHQLAAIEAHKHADDRSLTTPELPSDFQAEVDALTRQLYAFLSVKQRQIISDMIALDRGQV